MEGGTKSFMWSLLLVLVMFSLCLFIILLIRFELLSGHLLGKNGYIITILHECGVVIEAVLRVSVPPNGAKL